jgi:hypothetical protein
VISKRLVLAGCAALMAAGLSPTDAAAQHVYVGVGVGYYRPYYRPYYWGPYYYGGFYSPFYSPLLQSLLVSVLRPVWRSLLRPVVGERADRGEADGGRESTWTAIT